MNLLRKSRWDAYLLLALLCGGWVLAACGTKEPLKRIEPSDTVGIYSAVIRQIYVADDTFGGTLQPPTLYIIRYTDDKAGSPMGESGESVLLAESAQSEVTTALQDLPTEIVWVDAFEDVALDATTGSVVNGGAIITLGNIYPQEDGSVQVSGSIYVASLGAGGQTYVLTQIDGVWEITGTTGGRWIS